MTVEELMKPRYKVIAPYPRSENDGLAIGDILTDDGISAVTNQRGEYIIAFDWPVFHHIFFPLGWWQHRNSEDMPKYVRDKYNQVWEVEGHFKNPLGQHNTSGCLLKINDYPYCSYYKLTPATEQEYNDYINTKK